MRERYGTSLAITDDRRGKYSKIWREMVDTAMEISNTADLAATEVVGNAETRAATVRNDGLTGSKSVANATEMDNRGRAADDILPASSRPAPVRHVKLGTSGAQLDSNIMEETCITADISIKEKLWYLLRPKIAVDVRPMFS